ISGITLTNLSEKQPNNIKAILYGMLIIHFIITFYNPLSQIPTEKDKACGESFLSQISSIQGDIFIPYHGFYLTKIGKKPYCYIACLSDIELDKKDGKKLIDDFIETLKKKLENKEFSAIVLSNEGIPSFESFIRGYYPSAYTLFSPLQERDFLTITGWRRRPSYIYLPK
ncbi:MAG: hypothetical protein AB1397_05365, partial [bacterium]